jgi:hypothetical protein
MFYISYILNDLLHYLNISTYFGKVCNYKQQYQWHNTYIYSTKSPSFSNPDITTFGYYIPGVDIEMCRQRLKTHYYHKNQREYWFGRRNLMGKRIDHMFNDLKCMNYYGCKRITVASRYVAPIRPEKDIEVIIDRTISRRNIKLKL